MEYLSRYDLDYETTFKYIHDNLTSTNAFSSEILKNINFFYGKFFTLLPKKNTNQNRLHMFDQGGVLLQYPEKEYLIHGSKASYAKIPNTKEKIAEYILYDMQSNQQAILFDDVLRKKTDKNKSILFELHGVTYGNEIYYILNVKDATKQLILDSLRASNAVWHSLCVFFNKDIVIKKELALQDLQQLCLSINKIMLAAYDGEGYIFWERDTPH